VALFTYILQVCMHYTHKKSVLWHDKHQGLFLLYTHDIQLNLPQALPDQLEQKLFEHTPCHS